MMTRRAHRKQLLIATFTRLGGGPACARRPATEVNSMLDFPLRRIVRCGARTNSAVTTCVGKQ